MSSIPISDTRLYRTNKPCIECGTSTRVYSNHGNSKVRCPPCKKDKRARDRKAYRTRHRKSSRHYAGVLNWQVTACPDDPQLGLPMYNIGASFSWHDIVETQKLGFWPAGIEFSKNGSTFRVVQDRHGKTKLTNVKRRKN